ncbi:MAG: hypothetical protein RIN55_10470 [Tissierellaceae bacterium]|nr:hypothetical protein [Tissierellaceae bacterium]
MYNSFIIRIFVGAYDAFTLAYKGSILKRIVESFKRCISYLTNGSIFIGIFTKNYMFIETSIFYKLFSKILDFVTNIFKRLNDFFKRIGEESLIYTNISKLFGTNIALIRSLTVFVLFFAIGVIINNLIKGAFSGRSYILSFGLIFITMIILILGEGLEKFLNNSFIYRFIRDLFIIDEEGGDQWW